MSTRAHYLYAVILFIYILILSACVPLKQVSLDPGIPLIQSEIAAKDGPKGYYTTTYRNLESLYWENIPGWMRQDAAQHKAKRILDVGCGYGTLLGAATKIYGAEGYCIDVSPYLNADFIKEHGLEFAQRNIETAAIPWNQKFDVILLTEVLEHFNFQPLPTMRKLREALVPGGVLFLSTPDARDWGRELTYYKKLSQLPMPDPSVPVRDAHIWIYSQKELVELLTSAGFVIDRLDYSIGNGNRHFNIKAVAR